MKHDAKWAIGLALYLHDRAHGPPPRPPGARRWWEAPESTGSLIGDIIVWIVGFIVMTPLLWFLNLL